MLKKGLLAFMRPRPTAGAPAIETAIGALSSTMKTFHLTLPYGKA
jgi:hypothetical protein